MNDLLEAEGIDLSLAHAKFVKAIMGRVPAQREGQNRQGRRAHAGSAAQGGIDPGSPQNII